jgi:hypothetical protein
MFMTICVVMRAAWGREEMRGAWAGDGDQEGRLRVGVWGDNERQHMARHAHLRSEPALTFHPLTARRSFPATECFTAQTLAHGRHAAPTIHLEPRLVHVVLLWCLQLQRARTHPLKHWQLTSYRGCCLGWVLLRSLHRSKVKAMFQHAYEPYMQHAFPVRPHFPSCQ